MAMAAIVTGRSRREAAIEVPKRSRTQRTTESATRPWEPPWRIGKQAEATTTANDNAQRRRKPRAADISQFEERYPLRPFSSATIAARPITVKPASGQYRRSFPPFEPPLVLTSFSVKLPEGRTVPPAPRMNRGRSVRLAMGKWLFLAGSLSRPTKCEREPSRRHRVDNDRSIELNQGAFP